MDVGVPEFRIQLEQGQVDLVVSMIKASLVRIGAPAHYAAALGAAMRIEEAMTGGDVDRQEVERLEAELARIMAEHEPVEDAEVVEPEPEPVEDEPADPEPTDPLWAEFNSASP